MTKIRTVRGFVLASTVVTLALGGCGGGAPDEGGVGVATFTITRAPPDVGCLQITANGTTRSTTRVFPMTAGETTAAMSLTGLPTGEVAFSGAAFTQNCGEIPAGTEPAWVADPVTAVVTASPPVVVQLQFRRNGQATVVADFIDCGNAWVDTGEQCDDGGFTSGDGCSSGCLVEAGYTCSGNPSICTPETLPACGDGAVQALEQCDDGGTSSGDGCSATCQVEAGWTCQGEPTSCTFLCGDGIAVGSEQCDDGNLNDADGCSSSCLVEPGYHCSGTPSTCSPDVCGDGIRTGSEQCDDGNFINGDGCSDACTLEPLAAFVINEIDYDQPSIDTIDFVELYNGTQQTIDLTPLSLYLLNGSTPIPYAIVPLGNGPVSSLAAGQFLVIASASVTVPPGVPVIQQAVGGFLQNGADGVAIVDQSFTILDSVTYEGIVSWSSPIGFVTLDPNVPTDDPLTNPIGNPSIARIPDATTNWALTPNPTPGSANGF